MAHIHANPGEHDQTASAFIVRTDRTEPELLLHVHKKLGVLLQIGGHVELTENPWQAVSHEIVEETGYSLDQLKILQPKLRIASLEGATLHPLPLVYNTHNFDPEGVHKHTDVSYAFVTDSEPNGMPASGESTNFRWVDLEQLRSLEPGTIFENVRKIGEFVLTDILKEWQVIQMDEFEQ